MSSKTRLPVRAVALVSALALIACMLAASVASAQPKDPVTHSGCTHAGASYSHGSVRQGPPWIDRGKKVAREYVCTDGEWQATTTVVEVPKQSVKPAPVNPTPVIPKPVPPPPVTPPLAP